MIVAGRYRMVRLLGGEADGVVWQARDEVLHRDVALTEVRDTPERELLAAREAVRERRVTISGVHDLVDEGDRTWLVMELGDGGRKPVTIARRRRWVPAWVVAGVVLVTAGGVLAGVLALGDGDPARVNAPADGPGRFASRPKPCALISGDRLAELFSGARKPSATFDTSDSCVWEADSDLPSRFTPVVTLNVMWYPPSDAGPARADLRYEQLRTGEVRDLPGVGDEAFLQQGRLDGRLRVQVVLRMSNVVVRVVRYSKAGDDTLDVLRQGATSAAEAVAASLERL